MPRPHTKTQLIIESQQEYEALESLLAALTPEQMIQVGALGDWSPKDVLAHLYEWQQMLLRWYAAGLRGETPPIPAEGFKWSQLPALNQHIYAQYQDWPLEQVLEAFRTSHRKTVELIQGLSEADLTTPGLYPWMNQNMLIAYITANTGSHYRWARTEMRKNLRRQATRR
jgi:hypothetical protein